MMYLADQATPTELRLKGAPNGKTYIGPPDEPPGSTQDREVVLFNGNELIVRWMDSEVHGRYGTMVYMRCTEGANRSAKPRSGAQPRPNAAAARKSPA
jgi:hypothetical protein